MLKQALALIGLTLSLGANADIIDLGTITRDTSTGLDWLDLTVTANQSFEAVSARIAEGGDLFGWKYASSTSFYSLFVNLGATPMSCYNGGGFCGGSSENLDAAANHLSLFGDLTGNEDSFGLLGDRNGPVGRMFSRVKVNHDPDTLISTGYIYNRINWRQENHAAPNLGSYLIRTSEVPLPAAAWLFGSALLGLAGIKRKRA